MFLLFGRFQCSYYVLFVSYTFDLLIGMLNFTKIHIFIVNDR